MNGRLEHKIQTEQRLEPKIENAPEYFQKFYMFLSQKTHKTQLVYIENVLRFITALGDGTPISEDKLKEIDAFRVQKYLNSINYYYKNDELIELQPASKNIHISSINTFFKFLVIYNYIDKNPCENGAIQRAKVTEKDVIYLTAPEVRKVERAILNGVGSSRAMARQEKYKYRDMCLFWLPVCNGIRVSALSEININDVDWDKREIKNVIEKGNKTVTIYFDERGAVYLRMWMEQRSRILNGKKCDALFISNRREPSRITVMSIENLIAKYTESAIGRHISPHKLRSTFGTNFYNKTHDVELTAKALHHTSTVPTQRYVSVLKEDIKNAVQKGDLYI